MSTPRDDVLFEKINSINSTMDFIKKKLETIDNQQNELQLKVATMESFFKGMQTFLKSLSLLVTAVGCMGWYIYTQDKTNFRLNDDKHDQLFQILQDRMIKIEDKVK